MSDARRVTAAALPPTGVDAPTAIEMSAQLARGDSSATELLERSLETIDALEPQVKAWSFIDHAGARRRAQALDASGSAGGVHGLPFAIKDNIDTCDMPSEYGSPIHRGHVPTRDAACVASLRMAGANPLGKTVCTEFAHLAPGATRNPWDPEHTPGGSSSGSAAAVACAMVPFALGSQTTGSVIRPAAFCGVVGYKPTYGEFNVAGMMANTPSFDTLGVMARCVGDLVLVRRALLDASVCALEPAPLAGARVGICRTPYFSRAEDETQSLIEDTALRLERVGAHIEDFDDAGAFDGVDSANRTISGYEFARTLGHERRVAYQQLSETLRKGRMADGLVATYRDYVAARRRLDHARGTLDRALDAVDFLITPSAPGPAPRGLSATGSAEFNLLWTTLHAPAVTLPVASHSCGLPIGVQLVTARHEDDRLLAFADSVFRALAR